MLLAPGTMITEKLRIRREVGRGGMGVVLEAQDEALDRLVAVKVMIDPQATTASSRARFLREARAVAALRSEHVIDIYEVGELTDQTTTPTTTMPFLVMELLDGMTLEQFLETKGKPASIRDATRFILEASRALGEAHALGLIHRDVKLANMFLAKRVDGAGGNGDEESGSSIVKVIDFGIVKDTRPTAESLTKTGEGFGSPAYMSPEQIREGGADPLDASTDVWSLGVCLFELLTGRMPFAASTVPKVLLSVLNDAPPSVRSARPDTPAALEAIVSRCLEKDRTRRFANANELGAALLALDQQPPAAREEARAEGEKRRTSRKSPYIFTIAFLSVLLIAMTVVVIGWVRKSPVVVQAAPVPPSPTIIITSSSPPPPPPPSSELVSEIPSSSSSEPDLPKPPSMPKARKSVGAKIVLLGGSGNISITDAADRAIKQCLEIHPCPRDTITRLHLHSINEASFVSGTVASNQRCNDPGDCILARTKFWRPSCPNNGKTCDRFVEIRHN